MALFLLFLITLHALFRSSLGATSSLFLVALFALNPNLIRFTNKIMTDLPFLFYASFSLLLIDRFIVHGRIWRSEAFSFGLLGSFLFLAYWTRTVGALLAVTALLCQLIDWRISGPSGLVAYVKMHRFGLLTYLVPLVLVLVTGSLLPSANMGLSEQFAYLYNDGVMEAARSLWTQFMSYLTLPSEFFYSSVFPDWVGLAFFWLSVPALLLGLQRRYARDYAFILFSALYMGVLLVSDFFDGFRYLLPVLPVYIYFVFVGLRELHTAIGGRPGLATKVFAGGVLAVFVIHFAIRSTSPPVQVHPRNPFASAGRAMLEFIDENTRPDHVIAFSKPRSLTLMSGRRSIMVSRSEHLGDGRCDFAVLMKGPRIKNQVPVDTPRARVGIRRFPMLYQNEWYVILDVRGG
ncbi:MAG: hypothetical protein JRH01_25125 [Deltaproteobacteria bacterium]|nr:hypothetical protein [Deltaproteobacteria bacterium]